MSILPLHPGPWRPVRQLRQSTRSERPNQSILRPRPQHTRNERISQLVLRPPQTLRPPEKVRRGEPEPPRECAQLQPELDKRWIETPLANSRPSLGHPCTFQRCRGQDNLC